MGIVEGKVAIVTGGTRGIGFTIVREFLKNGAKVALAGSRQETVDAAASPSSPRRASPTTSWASRPH